MGRGGHEAEYARPHRRAPSAGILAGAGMGGSSVAGNGDGMPWHTATNMMAHDGRWTSRH
jgi:hypothetical protein